MDISEYNCGIDQEEAKKMDSYSLPADSGYDSICKGYTSVLMEKSFSRESFDIFSPNSPNRTPNKKSSDIKYHISTPKSTASVKRHLYSSLSTSSSISKRIKSENNENEPKIVSPSISKSGKIHDNSFPLKALNNNELLNSTDLLKSKKDESLNSKISTRKSYKEYQNEQVLVPERPSKNHRYFAPSVIRSKRKLDIVPATEPALRTYYNGARYLNIISRLEPFPYVLDDIFKNLNSKDLLNTSLVSKGWCRIIKSNSTANTRIRNYLNESHNVKENYREPVKLPHTSSIRHPFGQFNVISTSNRNTSTLPANSSFYENQNVVQQLLENERLVKCPRCSKASIVSNSSDRMLPTSCTRVPTAINNSQSATSVQNTESDSICVITKNKIESADLKSVCFGVCTHLTCGFMFCLKCLCDYHPGENCKLSDPKSPSKLLTCRKKSKLKNNSSCKLSSKRQSLRRLRFP